LVVLRNGVRGCALACLTTAAIIAAGTGAAGGLISLLVVRLERGSTPDKSILRNEENAS